MEWRYKEADTAIRLSEETGSPPFMIRHVTKHTWQVLALKADGPGGEPYYSYLFPVTQMCTTKREALEWMRAQIERRDTDYSKMPKLVHNGLGGTFYDKRGKPVRRKSA